MAGYHAPGPQRVDLLDRIRQEAGDETEADRLGPLKPAGWEAPSLLLAGMSSSLRTNLAEQYSVFTHADIRCGASRLVPAPSPIGLLAGAQTGSVCRRLARAQSP